jgi:hypothetical protein
VSLLSRVTRLENKVKSPTKPVHVVFQQFGESQDEVTSRIRSENFDPEDMLIIVKFLDPKPSFLTE